MLVVLPVTFENNVHSNQDSNQGSTENHFVELLVEPPGQVQVIAHIS